MLKNAYFLAKIGVDTAENEQHVAELLPKIEAPEPGEAPRGPPAVGVQRPRPARRGRPGAARGGRTKEADELFFFLLVI